MSMGQAVHSVLHKYADFSGRARRSEYWYWSLAVALGYVVVLILEALAPALGLALLAGAALGLFLPNLAVGVRRLHDTGKSAWYLLIALIPIVGPIALLVFLATDSTSGTNRYGPSPKELGFFDYPGQPSAW